MLDNGDIVKRMEREMREQENQTPMEMVGPEDDEYTVEYADFVLCEDGMWRNKGFHNGAQFSYQTALKTAAEKAHKTGNTMFIVNQTFGNEYSVEPDEHPIRDGEDDCCPGGPHPGCCEFCPADNCC